MLPIVFVVTTLTVFVVVCIALERRRHAAFNDRFPPISDAEFVARCRPGTDPAVALKVRQIVAEHFAVEYERVHPEMTFIEDLGVD